MDRIDKFLNRRKQKNKRTVKIRDKYFDITKEDVKIVRSYKKNACLDDTVDMYRPYKTEFTLNTMNEPLKEYKPLEKSDKTLLKEKRNFIRKNKDRVTKQTMVKEINKIEDVWEEDGLDSLRNYEQNILLDIKDQYNGEVDDLHLSKSMLENELRHVYLKQYLPRERKSYRIGDIIKEMPKVESLKPFPEEIGCYWNRSFVQYLPNKTNSLFVFVDEHSLEVTGLDLVLHLKIESSKKFEKAKFGYKNELIFTLDGKLCQIEEKDYIKDKFIHIMYDHLENPKVVETNDISEFIHHESVNLVTLSFKHRVKDFDCNVNGYVGCIIGKNLVIAKFEGYKSTSIYKIEGGTPLHVSFHSLYTYIAISTTNSVIVFDIISKKELANSKLFSYVISAQFKNDLIYIANNTGIIYIYDYIRNLVLYTMSQDTQILSMDIHQKYNLLSLSTDKELVIFYCNALKQQFVVVKRIKGVHGLLKFHRTCPWVYSRNNDRLVMYT